LTSVRRRPVSAFAVLPLLTLPLAVLAGWAVRPTASAPALSLATVSPADARQIFQKDCAVCHGADGKGTSKGPTLEGWGRAGVDYALTTGRMPLSSPDAKPTRQTPKYDAATIAALEDYIATLVPGGPDVPELDLASADLAQGGEVYRAQCAACHEWAGDGGALLNREAPPLGAATPAQIAEAVRTGPGTMPVFSQAAVSDSQLADVARYIQYINSPNDRGGQPLWHLGPVAEGGVGLLAVAVLLVVIRLLGSRS
jgi:ubiquinol-cytochrome c reductase cytochrome c subunit